MLPEAWTARVHEDAQEIKSERIHRTITVGDNWFQEALLPRTAESGRHEDHPPPDLIARYLDGALREPAQGQVGQHLLDCVRCREEMVAVRQTLRGHQRRKRLAIAVPMAVAAAGALLLLAPRGEPGADDRFRSTTDQRIPVVRPENGAVVTADTIWLEWRSAEPVIQYHLTVTDETGDAIVDQEVRDSRFPVLPDGQLEPGRTYLWFVDALYADGQAASTGVYRFTIP